MSIIKELSSNLEPNKPFTLNDAYQSVTSTDKRHSIRARIYEGIDKGLFKRVSQGVFTMIDHINKFHKELIFYNIISKI